MNYIQNKIKSYFIKIKSSKSFLFWNILFFISLISTLFVMISELTQYVQPMKDGKPDPTTKDAFQEHIYLFFKFTFLSNLMCCVVSFFAITNIISNENNHFRRIKVMNNANLTITMIVFWTLIFPKRGIGYYDVFGFITTIFAHLIVPILAIITFFIEAKYSSINKKINIVKTSTMNMIFIVLWTIIALILYFSFGGVKKDAIYSFMAILQNKWYKTLMIIIVVYSAYFGFNSLYTWMYKTKWKI